MVSQNVPQDPQKTQQNPRLNHKPRLGLENTPPLRPFRCICNTNDITYPLNVLSPCPVEKYNSHW